ncbi:hypothetical protein [Actinocorallia longicatena]
MDGIVMLVLLAILCAFVVQKVTGWLRLSTPARGAIMIVFVLVVLALWGQSLK